MYRSGSRASEFCCLYPIIRLFGCEIKCVVCKTTNWTCGSHNYILSFTGRGKYNGKSMCLQCLKERIEQS